MSCPLRPTPAAAAVARALFALGVAAGLAGLVPPAWADEKELAEVTVSGGAGGSSAARLGDLPSQLPAVAEGMSAAEIAEKVNVVDTADILRYLPSLQVRKRYEGDRNGIVANRTSGTLASARTLVYADGVLLSNFLGNRYDFPPRWGLVSPEEIERVDVIYGPFSAAMPGNSLGSTVLMTTRLPEKFEAHAKAQMFSERFGLYGTHDSYPGYQANATVGSRAGDLAAVFSANHIDAKGHPMSFATAGLSSTAAGAGDKVVSGAYKDSDPTGKGRVIFGATSIDHTVQDNAKLKLAYDFTPTLRGFYTVGVWQNNSDSTVQSYLRDAAGNPVYSGNVNIDGKRYTLNASQFQPSRRNEEHWMQAVGLKSTTRGEWDWEAVASWYNIAQDDTRAPSVALPAAQNGGAGTVAKGDGTGWQTLDLKGDWRPNGTGVGSHQVQFGYHYDRYVLDSRVYSTSNWLTGSLGQRTSAFSGKTETQALYVQDAWRFAPDWKLVLGGRYERWRAFDGATANATTTIHHGERDEGHFSPKLSLSFAATPVWLLRASVGQAYRMPTVQELFQGSISSGTIVNNDPSLKPEKALSSELTAERAFDNGLWRVSLFHENVRDALYSQTNVTVFPNVTNIQNIDQVRTQGVETSLQASDVGLRGLDLMGSVTYADSEILRNGKNPATVGKHQPRVPDWRATLVATWRQSAALSYTLAGRYSGKQYGNLDNSDTHGSTYGGVSSFFIVDVRVNYKIAKQVTASAGVNNLNNYQSFAAHPYPQRTVHAELRFDL